MSAESLIRQYVAAMQRGADGEDELLALFHEDAEYLESFSGEQQTHRGRAAIRTWLRSSWADQPPDIALSVDRVELDGETVTAEWTCNSSAFSSPSRGVDTYTVREGRIARLETVIIEPPTLAAAQD